jgi:acyl-CoA synthetase (AMP-forming)/AMP-acid ligase II
VTAGQPPTATIAAELSAAAAEYPDDIAICYEAERRTFGELRRDVWQAARGLVAVGVRPGDRIALWAPNTLDAAVALLATAVAGGVVVPLNTRYRRQEITGILQRAQCRLVLAPGSFLGRSFAAEALEVAEPARVVSLGGDDPAGARPWPQIVAAGDTGASGRELEARIASQSGDDVVVVQYTSGTTGQPKGAVLRQGPMLATAATWAEVVSMRHGDVYPVTYPLSHVGGFKTGVLTTLAARATCVLFPVVSTQTLVAAVRAHRPTIVNGPPPVLRSLLSAVRDGLLPASTRIRTVVTGSAIVPPPLVRELASVLGVADVIIAYGLTEATGVCTMTRRGDPLELVCETVGSAIDGVQVRIASPSAPGGPDGVTGPDSVTGPGSAAGPEGTGEIEVRGPNVMAGYLDDPAATAEVMDDGWLRTGDVGWIGDDGYVRIIGRARDMVVVGGFNVYPAEVEHVLADHPGVAEAAAVGVPDDRLGEVIAAFVVPSAGCAPAPDALTGWCRERLANFKVPRHVWVVDSLPRGTVGKVAKADLRTRALASLGAPEA